MPTFVLRVWLADRPGALGAVASRIGAVGGDVIGIDILERGDGRVIDELTVSLPDEDRIPLMLTKVGELDAVDVEDVRAVVAGLPHPQVDALEIGAELLRQQNVDELFVALVTGASEAFGAEWAAVVDPDGPVVLECSAGAPPAPWLEAFVTGTRVATPDPAHAASASDVAWASLEVSGLALLVGRPGRPFRARERRQLATLGRIGDHRWHDLVRAEGRRNHPAHSS